MATKRKSTKRKTTARRKVGAVRHITHHAAPRRRTRSKVGAVSPTVEILLGAVAGSFVTRVIQTNLPAPSNAKSMDLRPYTGLVVGAVAEFFGKKNLLIKSMGIGAIVEGARSIVADKYIPNLTGAKTAGLPYTVHGKQIGMKKMKRLMGLQNSLAGVGATSTPAALAAVAPSNHFIYDGA
jgi:hypothetical protein